MRLPPRPRSSHGRGWGVLLTLSLLAVMLPMRDGHGASALALNSPTVAPGAPGELTLQMQSDAGPVAFQLDLLFDSSRLATGFASPGGVAAAGHLVESSALAPGVTRILIYSLRNRTLGNGTLATLPLHGIPGMTTGVSPISITNVILAGVSGVATPPPTLTEGLVTLRDTAGPVLELPSLSAGQVTLRLRGDDGRAYTFQRSFDLVTWQDIASGTPAGGFLTYTDTQVVGVGAAYFRARESP